MNPNAPTLNPTEHTSMAHPTPMALEAGTHALCICGKSSNGAFCDGSHTKMQS